MTAQLIGHDLIRELEELPKRLAQRVAKKAFRAAIVNTYQDSGQAAFNMRYSINSGDNSESFVVANDGSEPTVGKRGDQRSSNGQQFVVARAKLQEFEAALQAAGRVNYILIYSPLIPAPGGRYAEHARIETALMKAANPGPLDEEIDHAMRSSRFR